MWRSTVDCRGRYVASEVVGVAFDGCVHSMEPEHRARAAESAEELRVFLRAVRSREKAVEVLRGLGVSPQVRDLATLKLMIEVAVTARWFPPHYVNERQG